MASSGFSDFDIKWSLIIPETNPPSSVKKDEFFRDDVSGPGSPFSPASTKFVGDSFYTKLFLDKVVYDVNGVIRSVSKENLEFQAHGEINFLKTILWGVGRIIFIPILGFIGSYISFYVIIYLIVLGVAQQNDMKSNFIISHNITPTWVAGNGAPVIAIIWFVIEVVAFIARIHGARYISEKAAQKIEAWLGRREQILRTL
jgi:hypothetical protein